MEACIKGESREVRLTPFPLPPLRSLTSKILQDPVLPLGFWGPSPIGFFTLPLVLNSTLDPWEPLRSLRAF